MKPTKHYFFTAVLLAAGLQLFAQKKEGATNTTVTIKEKKTASTFNEESSEQRNVNFIKLNLTAIALKNYSVQFERILGRKFSAAVSFRIMPTTSLPFRSQITKSIGNVSSNTTDIINNLQISNFAITPEFRMYLSKKGYGQGFYIAPFYRLANFKANNLKVDFTGETGAQNSLNLSGDLTSNTAGILLGAQWTVGKQLCIDWWIAGPHYGIGKGKFNGVSAKQLTQREQDELYRQINNLNVPFSEKTVHVDANGATMDLSGPWAGMRAGLSFGLRF